MTTMRAYPFEVAPACGHSLADCVDHLVLRIDLDAPLTQGGRARALTLIDLGQPPTGRPRPPHHACLVLPSRLFDSMLGKALASFHGERLTSPTSLFLGDHLIALMRHLERSGGQVPEPLLSLTPALVAACLPAVPGQLREAAAREQFKQVLMRRARRFIGERLRDPQLSPEQVARGIGMSRASLYRLFEPVGGVARAIRNARLSQALRDLQASSVTIGDIGFNLGFSSESQFSHAFKAYFGRSPREARHALAAGECIMPQDAEPRDIHNEVGPGWLLSLQDSPPQRVS